MKICDEHLYQLEKSMISTEALAQRVQLYRDGGRCLCCNTTDHHKCCQLPQHQQNKRNAGGHERYPHAMELWGRESCSAQLHRTQTDNYCFSDAYRMLQCAANVNANNTLGYRYYR